MSELTRLMGEENAALWSSLPLEIDGVDVQGDLAVGSTWVDGGYPALLWQGGESFMEPDGKPRLLEGIRDPRKAPDECPTVEQIKAGLSLYRRRFNEDPFIIMVQFFRGRFGMLYLGEGQEFDKAPPRRDLLPQERQALVEHLEAQGDLPETLQSALRVLRRP